VTIKALILDFDGLLMDTETTLLESWRYEWRQHGLSLDAADFFADHGGDLSEEKYAQLAAAVGAGYDRAVSHARRTAFRDGLHRTLAPAPGIRSLLASAVSQGLRLAVASSSRTPWVAGHLSRTGLLPGFDVLACGDEVPAAKPDPAVYLLALERLGMEPSSALAFEDTPHGVAAAQAAGLRCVAIPNAYVSASRFTTADLILHSAAEASLPEILARF
jgi:HAD superfamily hydrolase (TIGR01509 family)